MGQLQELTAGQDVQVLISDEAATVDAEVVSRNADGGYALQFQTPISSPLLENGSGPEKN